MDGNVGAGREVKPWGLWFIFQEDPRRDKTSTTVCTENVYTVSSSSCFSNIEAETVWMLKTIMCR